MIFVNTSLDTAQERNTERTRTLPEKEVEKMWKEVQTNIGKFQRLFGNKSFVSVDNNDAGEDVFAKVWKRVMVLIRNKVSNHIAKRWISQELAKKARK
jgi:thymidylate kinase